MTQLTLFDEPINPEYICPQCGELWNYYLTPGNTFPRYRTYGCPDDHYWIHWENPEEDYPWYRQGN